MNAENRSNNYYYYTIIEDCLFITLPCSFLEVLCRSGYKYLETDQNGLIRM